VAQLPCIDCDSVILPMNLFVKDCDISPNCLFCGCDVFPLNSANMHMCILDWLADVRNNFEMHLRWKLANSFNSTTLQVTANQVNVCQWQHRTNFLKINYCLVGELVVLELQGGNQMIASRLRLHQLYRSFYSKICGRMLQHCMQLWNELIAWNDYCSKIMFHFILPY